MSVLVIVTSLVSLATAATVFPYTPNQWTGGLSTNIFLPVGSGGLCGWEVELEFDYVINYIEPHNFLLREPQSNTQTFYIINQHWNVNVTANTELQLGFNAYFQEGQGQDLTVSITSAVITPNSNSCSGSAGSTGSTVAGFTTSTRSTNTESDTTVAPTATGSDTTLGSTNTGSDTTLGSTGSSTGGFPMTVQEQWSGGFKANACIPLTEDLCGWEIRMDFSEVITSISPHNFKLNGAQSNTKTYYLINEHWNTNRAAGTELCLSFNGATDYSNIRITSAVVTKPSSDGNPCSGSSGSTGTTGVGTETTTDSGSETTTATTDSGSETTAATTDSGSETTTTSTNAETTTDSPTSGTIANDYTEVLGKSILFYEAQRSGELPVDNRISWRGDSAVDDGSDNNVNLAGGWYDAGDHVKFNFPMAWSTTVLAWGVVKFQQGYEAAGQLNYIYDSLRWPLDYFIKCGDHPMFWGQVGNGNADHGVWTRPEDLNMDRPAYALTPSKPGSDLAGETAAALAAASIVFKTEDPTYSTTLLNNAKTWFDFAYNYRGTYVNEGGIPAGSFYNSWSGYNDELCWAAAWLYKATGESTYSDKAQEFLNTAVPSEFSWDNKAVGCQLLMHEANTVSTDLQGPIESFMSHWRSSAPTTPTCHLSYNGNNNWGSLRYSANAALIGLMAAEAGIQTEENRKWALSQIDYMLGANEQERSYVVGYGINPPQFAHHRAASCNPDHSITCSWDDYHSANPNPSVLNGALVGGPSITGSYQDIRSDFESNEVACDYNAGFQSVLAGLTKLEAEGNFPEHTNVCCNSQLSFCNV